MSNVDLLRMTISEMAPKIKNREVSPVELTEAALSEADLLQPTLNSFIQILHEHAMDQAREAEAAISQGKYLGPLHGIPIGLKDNLATAGLDWICLRYRDGKCHWIPDPTGYLVSD
jgi:aspartyl-tRNA(Asn)/glutamyl-tRNA(Gln) amidotransferase subunit A